MPIEGLDVSVYRVPTERPQADGTLEWDHTTVVVVRARGEGASGVGFTYGPEACAVVIRELLTKRVTGLDPAQLFVDANGGYTAKQAVSIAPKGYPDVYQAADAVPEVLSHGPIGLEGMDDRPVGYMLPTVSVAVHRSSSWPGAGRCTPQRRSSSRSAADREPAVRWDLSTC